MKRTSLAERTLWYLAAFAVVPLGGCAAMSEAFTPAKEGEKAPAVSVIESVGTAVSTVNPAIGGVILAIGGVLGLAYGRKKSATPPAPPVP